MIQNKFATELDGIGTLGHHIGHHIGMPHGLPHCGSTLGPTLRHHQNYKCIYISGQVSAIVVGNKTQQRKFTQIKKLNNFFQNSIYPAYFFLPLVRNLGRPGDCRWSDRLKMFMAGLSLESVISECFYSRCTVLNTFMISIHAQFILNSLE